MSDDDRVEIARLQERIGAMEKKYEALMSKIWGVGMVGFGWVVLQLLGMIGKN